MKKTLAALVALGSFLAMGSRADAHVTGRCPQYERLLARHGLPVATFSRIMYRESRCQPTAVNRRSGAAGLLQFTKVNYPWLSRKLGVQVTQRWLLDPHNNIHAAQALYRLSGTRPWKATR
jgi:hypothetical protein